ncbi:MAG: cupin domain-containing protein [Deltaproteobacteria bacterium]|nr:cupin domain-containing protein [Deltaproteobacteria bacterium]
MSEAAFHELKLGERIRRLREDRSLGVASVAEKTEIAEERLIAFEADAATPAVGDLARLASCLEVSVGHFFQTTLPEKRIEVVRADQRWSVHAGGDTAAGLGYRYQALSHGLTEKLMAPFLVEVPPGQERPLEPSSHEGEEFMFVLAGQLEVEVGGDVHQLGPGDAIYYDSRLPHTLRSLEGSTVKLLACIAQARRTGKENPIGRAYR